jgi:hypothetical protein
MVVSKLTFHESDKMNFYPTLSGLPGLNKAEGRSQKSRPTLGWKIEPLRGSCCPSLLVAPSNPSGADNAFPMRYALRVNEPYLKGH